MTLLANYKCPSCGGALDFDIKSGKLKCRYCDSEFEADEIVPPDARKFSEDGAPVVKNHYGEPEEPIARHPAPGDENTLLDTYSCKQCGGAVAVTATVVSTVCPFCGNNIVFYDKLTGNHVPDMVVPFKIDKNELKDKYFAHLRGKFFVPREFRRKNALDSLVGCYVPFWVYDMKVSGPAFFRAERMGAANTEIYQVMRDASMSFRMIPEDSCRAIRDEITESLEPYFFGDAVPFETGYLPGFTAHVYDESCESCARRAALRAAGSLKSQMRKRTMGGYSSIRDVGVEGAGPMGAIVPSDISARSVLYPMWLLTTKWRGKRYFFAMNGQTGAFVGNLPRNSLLYWGSVILSAALITYLAQRFLPGMELSNAAITGGVFGWGLNAAADARRISVRRATRAETYGDPASFVLKGREDRLIGVRSR